MLLNQDSLLNQVKQKCTEDTNEIILCSAFLKKNILEELEEFLNQSTKVKIFVRWQALDIVSGVSDLGVYHVCKKNGWELYYHKRLHAKFFLIDERFVFMGSSNYTLSGTGRGNRNIEWNKAIEVNFQEATELKQSLSLSMIVDDEVYYDISKRIKELEPIAQRIKEIQTSDIKPLYGFKYEWLPSFSPEELFNSPLTQETIRYLNLFDVESLDILDSFKEFILNNPITEIIREYHKQSSTRARWGSIRDEITKDPFLFRLCEDNFSILEKNLYTKNRLFYLFCWLQEFDESLELYHNPRYLDDPRRGTCSINLREHQ